MWVGFNQRCESMTRADRRVLVIEDDAQTARQIVDFLQSQQILLSRISWQV
jgi:hypothetical protein